MKNYECHECRWLKQFIHKLYQIQDFLIKLTKTLGRTNNYIQISISLNQRWTAYVCENAIMKSTHHFVCELKKLRPVSISTLVTPCKQTLWEHKQSSGYCCNSLLFGEFKAETAVFCHIGIIHFLWDNGNVLCRGPAVTEQAQGLPLLFTKWQSSRQLGGYCPGPQSLAT